MPRLPLPLWSLLVFSLCCISLVPSATGQNVSTPLQGSILRSGLYFASGIVYDSRGLLWVVDSLTGIVSCLTTNGVPVSNFTVVGLRTGQGMAIDSQGFLYVAAGNGGAVLKLNRTGSVVYSFTTANPSLRGPEDVAIDSFGNVFIADGANRRVVQLLPNGTQAQAWSAPPSNSTLGAPAVMGVAISPSGGLYALDSNLMEGRVLWLTPNNTLSVLVGGLPWSCGLAIDGKGSLFVTTPAGNAGSPGLWAVLEVSATGAIVRYLTTSNPGGFYNGWVTVDDVGAVYITTLGYLTPSTPWYGNVWKFANASQSSIAGVGASSSPPPPSSLSSSLSSTSSPPPPPSLSSPPVSSSMGSLCYLVYGLPGNVDYPWSSTVSLSFVYDPTVLTGAWGQAVALLSGSGVYTYTNRFGVSVSTPLTLSVSSQPGLENASTTTTTTSSSGSSLLYLDSPVPVDVDGLTLAMVSPVWLPGAGHAALHSSLRLYNMSGVVVEDGAATLDGLGQAFLSSLPGFSSGSGSVRNVSIASSNINALSVDSTHCAAPLQFNNGLRPPMQPSTSNGAARFSYSYHISDGSSYTVHTNLTITAQSAFASQQDGLGNPYQVIVNVTGFRVYTHLASGAVVTSAILGLLSAAGSGSSARFYPYSLLGATPSVYSSNTAPFQHGAFPGCRWADIRSVSCGA